MEEKVILAELIAEVEFLQQKQAVQEKLAKAKVYEEMEERVPLNPKNQKIMDLKKTHWLPLK